MFDRCDADTAFILDPGIQRFLNHQIPTSRNQRIDRDQIAAPKHNAVACRRRPQNDLGRTTVMKAMSSESDRL